MPTLLATLGLLFATRLLSPSRLLHDMMMMMMVDPPAITLAVVVLLYMYMGRGEKGGGCTRCVGHLRAPRGRVGPGLAALVHQAELVRHAVENLSDLEQLPVRRGQHLRAGAWGRGKGKKSGR